MTLDQALIHAYENAPQYHAILGAVIGAVASVAGAALSSRKQKSTSEVDYVKMVKNAEAAGFNPLTAIRNGGSQGFTTTTTSGGASALGQALQALGGPLGEAMQKKLDPVEQKRRQLDTALVDYQLRQLREGPKAMPGQLYPGGQFIGTKVTSNKRAADSAGAFIGPPSPQQYVKDNGGLELYVPYYNRFTKSVEFGPNPDIADSEQFGMPAAITGANAVLPGSASPWVKEKGGALRRGFDQLGAQPLVRSRPLTAAEKKEIDDSWLPSWVPRIRYISK